MSLLYYFLFVKQKTAYDMRISDWSSDLCSSDLRIIRDRDEIDRLNAIALPPAYEDAWFCPAPNGHILATGYDARGRKQYRYHPDFRMAREADKYDRCARSEEHTSELQSLMRSSYAVFCLKKKKQTNDQHT